MEERREHPRHQADLKVLCKPWESTAESPPEPIPFCPTTYDLSNNGVSIRTEEVMKVGLKLKIILSIDSLTEYLEMTGEVAWSKKKNGMALSGISFCDITPEITQYLEKLIQQIQEME